MVRGDRVNSVEAGAGIPTGNEPREDIFSGRTALLSPEDESSLSLTTFPLPSEAGVDSVSGQCCDPSIHRSDGYSGITARQRINTELTGRAGKNWHALG